MNNQEFIQKVAELVIKYAPSYGIKVHSPIIAQAILESGWGKSKLASSYFNFFGMKCGSKWTGKSVNLKTNEEYQVGTYTQISANFRVYDNFEEGIKGYFDFISISRYENLKGITDPETYLQTIKDDGYATSSKYVQNLMTVISENNLTQYDEKDGGNVAKTRSELVNQALSWLGCKESNGSHKKIIDLYNGHKPLARGYKVKYTDAWCATFVSACAIATGMTDIIPTECSCNYMIKGFQKLGKWMETDSYVPKIGDIIFYDWQDTGVGDNTGSSDHVGIVERVTDSAITVIEGNYSDSVKRRTIAINGRYIRGFGLPAYNKEETIPKEVENKTTKSVKATGTASNFNKSVAGTYVTTSSLHIRNGAGTNNKSLTVLPKGQKVQCYGYYSIASGKKWLYVQTTLDGVTYTGFCSSTYLKK